MKISRSNLGQFSHFHIFHACNVPAHIVKPHAIFSFVALVWINITTKDNSARSRWCIIRRGSIVFVADSGWYSLKATRCVSQWRPKVGSTDQSFFIDFYFNKMRSEEQGAHSGCMTYADRIDSGSVEICRESRTAFVKSASFKKGKLGLSLKPVRIKGSCGILRRFLDRSRKNRSPPS